MVKIYVFVIQSGKKWSEDKLLRTLSENTSMEGKDILLN